MHFKKVFSILVVFLISASNLGLVLGQEVETVEQTSLIQKEFYVSLNGSDTNDGLTENTPFGTIKKAQDEVRLVNDNMSGDIIVNIMNGEYFLPETLSFASEDSGSNGHNIIYRGDADNHPLISGGVDITDGWVLYDGTQGIYKRENIDWSFRQLYTNNDRAIRARWPNRDNNYDLVTSGPYERPTDVNDHNGRYPLALGSKPETKQMASYANDEGAAVEVNWLSSWSVYRGVIDNYDTNNSNGSTTFIEEHNGLAFNNHTQWAHPYFLENHYQYLDAEGEWFLDKSSQTLYYKPRADEVMNTTSIIAPKLETIIDIKGENSENKTQNISFENLQLMHTTWLAPDTYGYAVQQGGSRYQYIADEANKDVLHDIRINARYKALPGMAQLRYSSNVTFNNNDFKFSGSWGIMGYESTDHTMISHNSFEKNSSGAIFLGVVGERWDDRLSDNTEEVAAYPEMEGQSQYDSIMYNTVDRMGCDYGDVVGIGALLPQHITIAHNKLTNLPYTGIHVGWNWSDYDHGVTDVQVYQNYIKNVCLLVQDGGGIYTLGRMNGDSHFYYNYIENARQSEWAAWNNNMGIYFDNGSCYKKGSSNVIVNTEHAYEASNSPNHSNIFEGNYYDSVHGAGTVNGMSILNRSFDSNGTWPAEVVKIRDNAGPDGEVLEPPTFPVNHAFLKPVTASESDIDGGFIPENITDGDSSTRWAQLPIVSQPDRTKDPTWVQIDLEKETLLNEIIIKFQYGNRCRYHIEYSSDGVNWNTYVDKINLDPSHEDTIYETKADTSGRYIRITVDTHGWGNSIYEIYVYSGDINDPNSEITPKSAEFFKNHLSMTKDIEVTVLRNGSDLAQISNEDYVLVKDQDYIKYWDFITLKKEYLEKLDDGITNLTFAFDEGPERILAIDITDMSSEELTNVALDKLATSTSSSLDPKYLVDGDYSTRWAQRENEAAYPATITIDLEEIYDISSISAYWEQPSGHYYEISYSEDGEKWNVYADRTYTQDHWVTDAKKATARYINLLAAHPTWGASIFEIEVMGKLHTVPEDKWTITSILPKDNEIVPGTNNVFTIAIKSNNNSSSGNVFLAVYQNSETLNSTSIKNVVISGGITELEMELDIPSEKGNYIIKAFAWDDNISPLADVEDLNFNIK